MFLPLDWPLTPNALADPRWSWPIEWLRKLARYPREQQTWLGGPTRIFPNGEPPQPLGPNTQMSCFLLMATDSEAGWLARADGSQVVFFTVFPIYREERDLEVRLGSASLLEIFRASKVDLAVNVNRANLGLARRR